jgi:hypothetical protein
MNDIQTADSFPKDSSKTLDIKLTTADVGTAMASGSAALRTLSTYATLAWRDDKARQRAFGQDTWEAAHNNTLKLKEALELAHSRASSGTFQTELLAKGMQQADIDVLATLVVEIAIKNNVQEVAKGNRKVSR